MKSIILFLLLAMSLVSEAQKANLEISDNPIEGKNVEMHRVKGLADKWAEEYKKCKVCKHYYLIIGASAHVNEIADFSIDDGRDQKALFFVKIKMSKYFKNDMWDYNSFSSDVESGLEQKRAVVHFEIDNKKIFKTFHKSFISRMLAPNQKRA